MGYEWTAIPRYACNAMNEQCTHIHTHTRMLAHTYYDNALKAFLVLAKPKLRGALSSYSGKLLGQKKKTEEGL